jgi:hypothetical protein
MAEAVRKRQLGGLAAGTGLAHFSSMPDTLSDEARELLKHFHQLGAEERERIVALVRALRSATELMRLELQLPATPSLLA